MGGGCGGAVIAAIGGGAVFVWLPAPLGWGSLDLKTLSLPFLSQSSAVQKLKLYARLTLLTSLFVSVLCYASFRWRNPLVFIDLFLMQPRHLN